MPWNAMQCERLIRLIKNWYLHVKEETMAPARMMQFVDNHVRDCEVCGQDPDLPAEVEKIREIVLPESLIPKAVRMQQQGLAAGPEPVRDPFVRPPAAAAAAGQRGETAEVDDAYDDEEI